MKELLVFLLLLYSVASYGYIFNWAIVLYSAGYLKTQTEKDSWLLYYIFAPLVAPFIYGMQLSMK